MSTRLNAGVSESLAAPWAGRSMAVLKKAYAECLVGEEQRVMRQIDRVLERG